MSFRQRIEILESQQDEIKNARKAIKKEGKIKKRNRNILHNIDNVLRRELDTSPYQTIVTPGGLWIDYESDLKKGKVERFYNEKINEPFSKKYLKPNKDVMQEYMDDDFNVIYNEQHVATIEYTKFKEQDIPKEEKPSIFGRGKNRWKPNIGMEGAPKNSVIKAYYSGFATDGDFSRQVYRYRSFGSNNDKKLADILERANSGWKKGYKIVPYEPWGFNENFMNKNYKLVILTWGDFIPQLSLSRVDEKKAKPGDIENKNRSTRIAGLRAQRYKYRDRNHSQYVLVTSAASWMSKLERSRDELFTSVERTTVEQKVDGKSVDYHRWIPISYIQIYNKDDPDDIAYDGPFEDLI